MKDNKYYTPKIEEFHVGFEYEAKVKGSIETSYSTFIWHGHNSIVTEFNSSTIRVKYLDREDVEGLGFIPVADEWWHKTNIGDNWQILKISKNGYQISYGQHEYIDKSKGIFKGVIKNKSELKRLLKQLEM